MQTSRLCQLMDIRYPIVQAGMVWASDWHLAAAACNAGILGTLGLGSMTPEEVDENIEQMKKTTCQSFAVNIPLLRPDAADLVARAHEKEVPVFITSAGNPERIASFVRQRSAIWIHVVPSVKGAQKAEQIGVDAVVCEGYEAGGHNSPLEITTLALVPQVVDAVRIPVIAAGGISDGRGIAAVMALGADGAQLGTRFIATIECQAHAHHKQLIVDAPDSGTAIIGRKLDMLRVLKNEFANRMLEAENQGADREALMEIIGDEFNRNRAGSMLGDLAEGAFQAGQSAGLVRDIVSVATLVKRLVREYHAAREGLWKIE